MHIFKLNKEQKQTNLDIANYMKNVPFDMFCFGNDFRDDAKGYHMKRGSDRGSVVIPPGKILGSGEERNVLLYGWDRTVRRIDGYAQI